MEDDILNFGVYKGKKLTDPCIAISYMKWLASRGSYPEPGNSFETKWKVPINISILARREMERRGYKRKNDKYEKE